ncbi:MAG: hypothetical protein V3T88_02905 [Nitrosomonadaceae bacterium]
MSLKINIVEKHAKKSYNDLESGDIFQFGTDFRAVGLKLSKGHAVLEYVNGINGFDYEEYDCIGGHPILFCGRLTGLEVEKCGN